MGFDLGAFAGGIGSGIEQGQQIRENYEKRAKEARARKADLALDQSLRSQVQPTVPGTAKPLAMPGMVPGSGTSPPGSTGGAPAGGGAPAPTAGAAPVPMGLRPAIPGAQPFTPPPSMAGGPMGARPPMPGAQPVPGAPQGSAPPMPGAQPGSAPPMGATRPPVPGPQAGGGPPPPQTLGGQANLGRMQKPLKKPGDPGYDPIEDSMARTHSYIQSIAQDLYSAEPNKQWKPGELLDEIRSYVELSNSLSPEEKALAQAQMGLINASIRSQSVNNRENDFQEGEKDKRDWRTAQQDHWKDVLQNSLQRVSMAQDGATKRTAMQDATRMSAEYLMQQGANGRAQAALDLRAQIAQAGLDDKEWADQTRDQLIADGLDTNAATRLFAAQASSAPVGQAPKPPAIKTHGAVGGAPRNSISAPRVGGAGAGQGAAGTQANPARPKTIQEAQKLPKGTYFVDPSGNVILKH